MLPSLLLLNRTNLLRDLNLHQKMDFVDETEEMKSESMLSAAGDVKLLSDV